MRWSVFMVEDGCCPAPCSVCGREFPDPTIPNGDVIYWPVPESLTNEEYALIRRVWGVDPMCDFHVCEGCRNHDPGEHWLEAGNWLDHWAQVWPLSQRLRAVGAEIEYPDSYPVPNHIRCLECGLIYSPAAGRVRGFWRCPNGCHAGLRLPSLDEAMGRRRRLKLVGGDRGCGRAPGG